MFNSCKNLQLIMIWWCVGSCGHK